MNTVASSIVCPKCNERFLRKSMDSLPKSGLEYFCHRCHQYFGIAELVNVWNYDAADFYGTNGQAQLHPEDWSIAIFWMKKSREAMARKVVSFFTEPEGDWSSDIARDESYDVVNRMFMGIEELEWDFNTNDLPCPILMTGMC